MQDTPQAPANQRIWDIALISFSILILELAFIRLVPAEVRAISYFTNLMFMAAFVGMGLGCILQRQRSMSWTIPVGMLLVFGFVWFGRGVVIHAGAEEVHFWLDYEQMEGTAPDLPLFPAALAIFLFSALPFVGMGQHLARAMERQPRLVAYGRDIAGSFAGVVAFAVASGVGLPPWIIPPLVAAVWAVLLLRGTALRVTTVLGGCAFILLVSSPLPAEWSPYYLIKVREEPGGHSILVNSSFHQFAIDFTSDEPGTRARKQDVLLKWSRPYQFYRLLHERPPGKVLILGAGSGNDVFVARYNGAEEIVAVEIDPVILEFGIERNPSRPYSDPSVRTVVDDARHFLRTTEERFDLIVFGTLDSQALLSGYSNLRLENFVYTREALEDARRVLTDEGVVALYYSVFKPWLYARIFSTVRAAFGDQVRIHHEQSPVLYNTLVMATKGIEAFREEEQVVAELGQAIPSTDDWPFIYLERPTIGSLYVKFLGAVGVVLLGVFFLVRRLHPVRGLYANFFLLGVGFTLMESSAIVRLALVFGSTWTVNAVVFGSVLLTVWLANRMVQSRRAPSLPLAWAGLGGFVLLNYLFPLPWLFALDTLPRVLACGLLIGIPVYFAAVCFSRLFEREDTTGYALGVNLVGAMGGLVEYLSMAIGMRSIWLIVFAIYALAFGFTKLAGRR